MYVSAGAVDAHQRQVSQGRLRAALLALALSTGCYEPETVDCTVTCEAVEECAIDQVCGADGYCAAPEVAGHCREGETQTRVTLEITIAGHGRVTVDGIGDCDSGPDENRTCTFPVTPNQPRQLKANEGGDREFVAWSAACAGDAETCDLTPVTPLTRVGARFE